MSKVRDSSAPKLILGTCWGACTWLLAIPHQACLSINFKVLIWTMSQQLELIAFSGSFLSSGEMLLNWLRGEPNKKQVLGNWTIFIATVDILVLDDIKTLSDGISKGNILWHKRNSTHLSLDDICNQCLKLTVHDHFLSFLKWHFSFFKLNDINLHGHFL